MRFPAALSSAHVCQQNPNYQRRFKTLPQPPPAGTTTTFQIGRRNNDNPAAVDNYNRLSNDDNNPTADNDHDEHHYYNSGAARDPDEQLSADRRHRDHQSCARRGDPRDCDSPAGVQHRTPRHRAERVRVRFEGETHTSDFRAEWECSELKITQNETGED